MKKSVLMLIAMLALLMVLSACGGADEPAAVDEPAPVADQAPAVEEPAMSYKMAAIFPGTITDADYNTLGYIGLTSVGTDLGIPVAYSENVAVPDVDGVMRQYLDDGFNIIFTHGGQFVTQTKDLAVEFPDRYFIAEFDGPVDDAPANFWVIDRNFHIGFYAIGALAAQMTETGKIGYIGGLTLPFSYAEVHAMEQAIADSGLDVELNPVWGGDFNDPSKARELAEAMIADDVDVLVGSLNLGMFGIFEAAKSAGPAVKVTAKYTDKSSFAPDNYATSLLYDFAGPLKEIVQNIMDGNTGGYYPLGFNTGVSLHSPLRNVADGLDASINTIIDQLKSGEIVVVKNTDPVE